jgi:hypothetical protein
MTGLQSSPELIENKYLNLLMCGESNSKAFFSLDNVVRLYRPYTVLGTRQSHDKEVET